MVMKMVVSQLVRVCVGETGLWLLVRVGEKCCVIWVLSNCCVSDGGRKVCKCVTAVELDEQR